MNLTICLLTKGRKEYLKEALVSYEKFIETGRVNVILIDNGADEISKEILLNWKLKHNKKVSYIRNEKNNPGGFTVFWEEIKSLGPEWILNPGDDDILVFDAYEEWVKAIESNPTLIAFASSAQIIDSSGKITGEIRTPSISGISNQIEMISRSMHQPPFFWPSLFFKFSAVPEPVINSRFAHDWWIGLHLILKGQVLSTNNIGVKYRVHKNQESFQSSQRRKFFEGYNMLTNVINSDQFIELLRRMSNLDIEELLCSCIAIKPIYSQPEYYISVMKELSLNIAKVSKSDFIQKCISENYILSSGIYTKRGDLENLYTGLNLSVKESSGNLALNISNNVCAALFDIKKFFNENAQTKVSISCQHSKRKNKSVVIDCSDFANLNEMEISDRVLNIINEHLESSGVFSFTISPFERSLIIIYRKLKLKFPRIFKKYLYKMKKFVS